jgi:hypothetical protein
MANETDLSIKVRVPIQEKFVYAIALPKNDAANVLPIRALIEKDIQRQISYQATDEWHSFNRDVLQAWIILVIL